MELFLKFGIFGREVARWFTIGPEEPRGIAFLVGAIVFVFLMAGLWCASKLLTVLLIIAFGVLFGFITAAGILVISIILGQLFNRGTKSKRMTTRNTSSSNQYYQRNKMFHEGEKEKAILDEIMKEYKLCYMVYSGNGKKQVPAIKPWRLAHRRVARKEYAKRLTNAGIRYEKDEYEHLAEVWEKAEKRGYRLKSPWIDIIEADYYYFFKKPLPNNSPLYSITEDRRLVLMWVQTFEDPEAVPKVKAIMEELEKRAKERQGVTVNGRR